LGNWRHEIAAWHHADVSNGPTEAANNLIKRVKRAAFGFRAFRHYGSRRSSTPASPSGPARGDQPPLTLGLFAVSRICSTHETVGNCTFGQRRSRALHDRCSGRPNRQALALNEVGLSECRSRATVPALRHVVSGLDLDPQSRFVLVDPDGMGFGKPIMIAAIRSGSLSVRPSMFEG